MQEAGEEQGLPVQGTCPGCGKPQSWADVLARSESVPWRQKGYVKEHHHSQHKSCSLHLLLFKSKVLLCYSLQFVQGRVSDSDLMICCQRHVCLIAAHSDELENAESVMLAC